MSTLRDKASQRDHAVIPVVEISRSLDHSTGLALLTVSIEISDIEISQKVSDTIQEYFLLDHSTVRASFKGIYSISGSRDLAKTLSQYKACLVKLG